VNKIGKIKTAIRMSNVIFMQLTPSSATPNVGWAKLEENGGRKCWPSQADPGRGWLQRPDGQILFAAGVEV
jgi:hypothetical protein